MTPTTLRIETFLQEVQQNGGRIDLNNAAVRKALVDNGVDVGRLRRRVSRDGIVSTDNEFVQLWKALDRLESNGDRLSVDLTRTPANATAPVPTGPAKLYRILRSHAQTSGDSRPYTRQRFVAELGGFYGSIDIQRLSPETHAALDAVGVDRERLRDLAGPDGVIRGQVSVGKLKGQMIDSGEMGALYDAIVEHTDEPSAGIRLNEKPLSPAAKAFLQLRAHVRANRRLRRHQRPGTQVEALPRPTVNGNALNKPKADRLPAVALQVAHKNQFSLYPGEREKGALACFEAAKLQTTTYIRSSMREADRPKLRGPAHAIQVAYGEDSDGRVAADPQRARAARAYIDDALDAGWPVLVGVSYEDQRYNADRITDHFVTITGRDHDENGRLFYTFVDPGTVGGTYRLYVDVQTGNLFKEGRLQAEFVKAMDYSLTHVRTYDRHPSRSAP